MASSKREMTDNVFAIASTLFAIVSSGRSMTSSERSTTDNVYAIAFS